VKEIELSGSTEGFLRLPFLIDAIFVYNLELSPTLETDFACVDDPGRLVSAYHVDCGPDVSLFNPANDALDETEQEDAGGEGCS
jgi:hypothetical protein